MNAQKFYKIGFWILAGITCIALCVSVYFGTTRDPFGSIREQRLSIESLTKELNGAKDHVATLKTDLAKSQQSVVYLEDLDRRRAEGIERLRASIESTGKRINEAQSGIEGTRAALNGISDIVVILEEEFGRSTK